MVGAETPRLILTLKVFCTEWATSLRACLCVNLQNGRSSEIQNGNGGQESRRGWHNCGEQTLRDGTRVSNAAKKEERLVLAAGQTRLSKTVESNELYVLSCCTTDTVRKSVAKFFGGHYDYLLIYLLTYEYLAGLERDARRSRGVVILACRRFGGIKTKTDRSTFKPKAPLNGSYNTRRIILFFLQDVVFTSARRRWWRKTVNIAYPWILLLFNDYSPSAVVRDGSGTRRTRWISINRVE